MSANNNAQQFDLGKLTLHGLDAVKRGRLVYVDLISYALQAVASLPRCWAAHLACRPIALGSHAFPACCDSHSAVPAAPPALLEAKS